MKAIVEWLDTGLVKVDINGQEHLCTEAHFRHEGELQIADVSIVLNAEVEGSSEQPPKKKKTRYMDDPD